MLGIPTFTVVTHIFETLAKAQAAARGLPDLRLLVVPHPIAAKSQAELAEIVSNLLSPVESGWDLVDKKAGNA